MNLSLLTSLHLKVPFRSLTYSISTANNWRRYFSLVPRYAVQFSLLDHKRSRSDDGMSFVKSPEQVLTTFPEILGKILGGS